MQQSGSIVESPDTSAVRARLHRMWSSVAGGWAAHADFVDSRGAAITEAMLELVSPKPGERVLELACGPGSVGLAAAPLVGPRGHVVLSDIAPEMTAIAADSADSLGFGNVSTRELDLEEIDEPDGEYDVVLCREGLMLTPDTARAAAEITRVLRPGGRTAVAVWGPRERNPWLAIVFDSVSAELGTPMPPPGIPGPFSLDRADRLESTLAGAGLGQVSVRELETPYHSVSVGEWWERTCDLAGPLAQKLAELPESKRKALRGRAEQAIAIYETSDGLDVPGVTLVAGGARQS